MAINIFISDLFFNLDLDHARRFDKKGQFDCFDNNILRQEADWLLETLSKLGVPPQFIPTRDELVTNFLRRV